MSSSDLEGALVLVLCWSVWMRDGPETLFNLVLGALFFTSEEGCGTNPGEERARENSWYIFLHQRPHISFSLIEKKRPFLGGCGETRDLSHFALVTNHVPDKERKAFFHLFLEHSCSDSMTTKGIIQHCTVILGVWLLWKHMKTQPWKK